MLESIKQCKRCNLCNNQNPLLDNKRTCDVMWVGLSAKKVDNIEEDIPLSEDTNSGSVIAEIESRCTGVKTYKTNLVKCLPLDENNKLRYPNSKEIKCCFNNLIEEVEMLNPKIIFLLGSQVTTAVQKNLKIEFIKERDSDLKTAQYNSIEFVAVYHPSYVCSYRRKYKDTYVGQISGFINKKSKMGENNFCKILV